MSKFSLNIAFDTIGELQTQLAGLLTKDTEMKLSGAVKDTGNDTSVITEAPVALDDDEDTPLTDKTGRMWDVRIDSGSKKQTKQGYWSRRKNLEDADYDRVIAELTGGVPQSNVIMDDQPAAPAAPPSSIPAPPPAPAAPPASTVTYTMDDIQKHVMRCRNELNTPDLNTLLETTAKSAGLASFGELFMSEVGIAKTTQFFELLIKATTVS